MSDSFSSPSGGRDERSVIRQLRDVVLEVDPEEVILDAKAAGLSVESVEGFRSLNGNYFLVNRLGNEYARRTSRWCAASGASAGIGGPVTAISLGVGDLANMAAQLYRLSQKLAILHGFDPSNSLQRERAQEIYYMALGLDAATIAVLRKMAVEAAKRAGKPYATRSLMIKIVMVVAKGIGARITTTQAVKYVPVLGGLLARLWPFEVARRAVAYLPDSVCKRSPRCHCHPLSLPSW